MTLILSSAALLAVLAQLTGPALAEEGKCRLGSSLMSTSVPLLCPSPARALPDPLPVDGRVPSGATLGSSPAIWSPSGYSWPPRRMQMELSGPSFCLFG